MDRNTKHNKAMAKQKAAVDKGIAKADIERGVSILLTGDGKGKTSSAFGMVMRALGMRTGKRYPSRPPRACATAWRY